MIPGKIERLCLRARDAIEARDWEKAKQTYLMALGLKSDAPDIHMGLATVYFQLRELTSAAHHFKEVTRLDPLRAGAYINLGAVLNLLQQLDEAIAALRRGIQLDPQRVEGYYNLGLVYRRKGQLDLSIQAYREAIRLNPRMPDAYLNLANLHVEKQQYKQAIQNYDDALKLRPDWDRALEGREYVEGVLAGVEPPKSSKTQPAGSQGRKPRSSSGEIEKTVDPNLHGNLLTALHQGADTSAEMGQQFQRVLSDELEGAIKDLSSCLLHADGSRGELDSCVTRFQSAVEHMRTVQETLDASVSRLESLGKHIPAP